MTEAAELQLHCAQINFENLERMRPDIARDVFYRIAKGQLDEALGGMPLVERFQMDLKRVLKGKLDAAGGGDAGGEG